MRLAPGRTVLPFSMIKGLIIGGLLFSATNSHAQARVDLDDLNVTGEILNDNRLRMTTRESAQVQDRVKYRKDFRSRIIDGGDVRVPAAETMERAIDDGEAK